MLTSSDDPGDDMFVDDPDDDLHLDPDAIVDQIQQMISPHLGAVHRGGGGLATDFGGNNGGGLDEDPRDWLDRDDE